jgi:hypothetical protein
MQEATTSKAATSKAKPKTPPASKRGRKKAAPAKSAPAKKEAPAKKAAPAKAEAAPGKKSNANTYIA